MLPINKLVTENRKLMIKQTCSIEKEKLLLEAEQTDRQYI